MPRQKSISQVIALHLIAILLVILNICNIQIVGLSSVIPLLDLMAVFYFAVFRNVFGIWFIFLLGIWNDALSGNPLGTTALCYILLVKFFLVLNHRMMIRENFRQIWQQFIFFCLLFLIMKWLILSIFSGQFLSFTNALVQLALAVPTYILIHKFFDYLSNKLLGKD